MKLGFGFSLTALVLCNAQTPPPAVPVHLPPGVPQQYSAAELKRCVQELGFVGCNLNHDQYGG